MSAPIVSVIMAAYNGAALLPETLASLQAQTFGDFELIVVDDRSPDDTLALLHGWSDHRIHVIAAAENQGPVKARNRAFAQARGRYIAAPDQDDICLPDRFARRSEEHTSELQSLMRLSYAVYCLKHKHIKHIQNNSED